jgi:hypothetical protein
VLEYVGEVVSAQMVADKAYCTRYCADLGYAVVDARTKGNEARFINHHCSPNCELLEVLRGAALRLMVVVVKGRTVQPGDWLGIDYAIHASTQEEEDAACHCGAENCSGSLFYPRLRPEEAHPLLGDIPLPEHVYHFAQGVGITNQDEVAWETREQDKKLKWRWFNQVVLMHSHMKVCALSLAPNALSSLHTGALRTCIQ